MNIVKANSKYIYNDKEYTIDFTTAYEFFYCSKGYEDVIVVKYDSFNESFPVCLEGEEAEKYRNAILDDAVKDEVDVEILNPTTKYFFDWMKENEKNR